MSRRNSILDTFTHEELLCLTDLSHTLGGQTTLLLSKISYSTASFKQRNDSEAPTVTLSGGESIRSHGDTPSGFEHWTTKAKAIFTLQAAEQQVLCICI